MRRVGRVGRSGASRRGAAGSAPALALAGFLVVAALVGVVPLAEPDPDRRSGPEVAGTALARAATVPEGAPSDPARLPGWPRPATGPSDATGSPDPGGATDAAGQPDVAEPTGGPAEEELPPPVPRGFVRRGAAAGAAGILDGVATRFPSTIVGVAVLDRRTGELADGVYGATQLYSASLVKLVVAVDVLSQRRAGAVVTDADLALVRRALGSSDDAAMNALWSRFDGVGGVQRVAQRLGLVATSPPADPSQWGETMVSAHDVVAVFDHVLTDLPAEDRDVILSALASAPPTAADGFDQWFGLLAGGMPPGLAVKQGWLCCLQGSSYLHSAGTIDPDRRYVVALLSAVPRGTGYDGAREALDVLADAARGALL